MTYDHSQSAEYKQFEKEMNQAVARLSEAAIPGTQWVIVEEEGFLRVGVCLNDDAVAFMSNKMAGVGRTFEIARERFCDNYLKRKGAA